jgi:hypothetical protein
MKVAGIIVSILAAFFGIWVATDFITHEKSREHANEQMSLHAFEKTPEYQNAVTEVSEAEMSERTDAIMGGGAAFLLGAGFLLYESSVKSRLKRGPL